MKISKIDNIMKKRGISKSIQLKVKKYLEYMHQEEKKEGNLNVLLESLPNKMQEEVFKDMYSIKLANIPIFKNFSPNFLNHLSLKAKGISFAPGDLIFLVRIYLKIN